MRIRDDERAFREAAEAELKARGIVHAGDLAERLGIHPQRGERMLRRMLAEPATRKRIAPLLAPASAGETVEERIEHTVLPVDYFARNDAAEEAEIEAEDAADDEE